MTNYPFPEVPRRLRLRARSEISERARSRKRLSTGVLVIAALLCAGCTPLREWLHNGLKVGPNYAEPPARVAPTWVQADDPRVQTTPTSLCAWWTVFDDPTLNSLIEAAYRENLDLKTAAMRVLTARAEASKAAGSLLPQTQEAVGAYVHGQVGKNLVQGAFPSIFNVFANGMFMSWELDLWGHLRRQLESARADLGAAQENYKDVLVILLSDVATNYVQLRTFQQRLEIARQNVEIQRASLELTTSRFRNGAVTELDVQQARSNLAQTEASLAPLRTGLWQANYQLCILLGDPPRDLMHTLEDRPIPTAPVTAGVGIPADLLRRRPDVRRAEREAASQCAQIGVAEADFYPTLSVLGFLGYTTSDIRAIFNGNSFTGIVAPTFTWKILNYGRILNNVRAQDARFQEKLLTYQQAVLRAGREAEDALVAFLESQQQARSLAESVQASARSVQLVTSQYRNGSTDFNRVFSTEETLRRQQDQLAVAQQDIALNLIRVYRALGGGWESFECPPMTTGNPSPQP